MEVLIHRAKAGPRHRREGRHALTLAELMVVIGVIAILVAILLPALAKIRDAAARVRCASNLHQLGTAFLLYADANEGCYPFVASRSNYPFTSPPFWSPNPAADLPEDWIHWRTPEAQGGVKTSAVARYLAAQNPSLEQVFRCPSDVIERHGALQQIYDPNPTGWATYGVYRFSYTMNGYLDPRGLWTDSKNQIVSGRLARIHTPSTKILLVEESEATINDGQWKAGNYYTKARDGSYEWNVEFDRLSIRHDSTHNDDVQAVIGEGPNSQNWYLWIGRGNACFCDGHVEFISRAFAHNPAHILPELDWAPDLTPVAASSQ